MCSFLFFFSFCNIIMFSSNCIPYKGIQKQAAISVLHSQLLQVISNRLPLQFLIPYYKCSLAIKNFLPSNQPLFFQYPFCIKSLLLSQKNSSVLILLLIGRVICWVFITILQTPASDSLQFLPKQFHLVFFSVFEKCPCVSIIFISVATGKGPIIHSFTYKYIVELKYIYQGFKKSHPTKLVLDI